MPKWYGLAHIGAIQGVSVLIGVAASALGPVALAPVNDQLGGYGAVAGVFVAIPLALTLATLAMSEPESEPQPS